MISYAELAKWFPAKFTDDAGRWYRAATPDELGPDGGWVYLVYRTASDATPSWWVLAVTSTEEWEGNAEPPQRRDLVSERVEVAKITIEDWVTGQP